MKIFGILREPDGEGKLTEINGAGAGGVTWDTLPNKPFYEKVTRLVGCENQVVEVIAQNDPSGTLYYGATSPALGELGTVTGSADDMNLSLKWNIQAGDRVTFVLDGDTYEFVLPSPFYGIEFGNASLYSSYVTNYYPDLDFYLKSTTAGTFVLYMGAENAGTHEISVYVEHVEEIKRIEEKYIPETIARALTGGLDHEVSWTLSAGLTEKEGVWKITTGDENIVPRMYVYGAYQVDDTSVTYYIPVEWYLRRSEGSSSFSVCVKIPEALESDLEIHVLSNFELVGTLM